MSPDLCFRGNRCERFTPTRKHAMVLGSADNVYLHLALLLSHRPKLICYSFTWFHACKRIKAFVYMQLEGGSWALGGVCVCLCLCVCVSNRLSAVFTPSSTRNHFHLFIPTEKPQFVPRFGVAYISRILVQLTAPCMCLFSQCICSSCRFSGHICPAHLILLYVLLSAVVCIFISISEQESWLALTRCFMACSSAADSFIGGLIGGIDCGVSAKDFTF